MLFASHSLLRDPPFSRLDVISCRNLLIYLDKELQQQVCGTFCYALNPGGIPLFGLVGNRGSTGRPVPHHRSRRPHLPLHRSGRRQASHPAGADLISYHRTRAAIGSVARFPKHRQRCHAAPPDAGEGRPAQHAGRRVAPDHSPFRQCRPVYAALGRAAERRCKRPCPPGASFRSQSGSAPGL